MSSTEDDDHAHDSPFSAVNTPLTERLDAILDIVQRGNRISIYVDGAGNRCKHGVQLAECNTDCPACFEEAMEILIQGFLPDAKA